MKAKRIIKFIFVVLIIIGIYYGIKIAISNTNPEKPREKILTEVFKDIQTIEVDATKIYTYGKAINISGEISNLSADNFENAKLVICDGYEYEKSYNLNYNLDKAQKKLYFSTDNNMNKGVVIDELPEGEYFFLIRIKTNNSIDPKYYSLKPIEEIKEGLDIDYYTVTKDSINKNMKIEF